MNYALYTLLFSVFTLNPGNGCSSSNTVKPLPKVRSVHDVVQGLPLERVLMLHLRARTVDYNAYNLAQEDQALFRKTVAARYEEHKEQIDAMAQDSDNRFRQAVHVPVVRQIRKDRRQTKRIKFADSVVLQMKRN